MSCKQKADALEARLAQKQNGSAPEKRQGQSRFAKPLWLVGLTLTAAAVLLFCHLT